jgi:hypothetical protein
VPLVLGRGDGDLSRTGKFPPGVAPASPVLAAAALLLAGGVGLSVLTGWPAVAERRRRRPARVTGSGPWRPRS